jgi:hypothetical protein
MLELTFTPDPEEVARAIGINLVREEVDVQYHYFACDVRLTINGVEMFEHPDWAGDGERLLPALGVTLLSIGPEGLEAVRRAKNDGSSGYGFIEGAGDVDFKLDGDQMLITSHIFGMPERSVRVPYAELLARWEHFCNEIRSYLWEQVPQLREHAFWGAWLRGAEYEDIPGPPWRIS